MFVKDLLCPITADLVDMVLWSNDRGIHAVVDAGFCSPSERLLLAGRWNERAEAASLGGPIVGQLLVSRFVAKDASILEYARTSHRYPWAFITGDDSAEQGWWDLFHVPVSYHQTVEFLLVLLFMCRYSSLTRMIQADVYPREHLVEWKNRGNPQHMCSRPYVNPRDGCSDRRSSPAPNAPLNLG